MGNECRTCKTVEQHEAVHEESFDRTPVIHEVHEETDHIQDRCMLISENHSQGLRSKELI